MNPKKNQIWGGAYGPSVKVLGVKNEFVYYIGVNGNTQPLHKKYIGGFKARYKRFV